MLSRILLGCACAALTFPALAADRSSLDVLITRHAQAHGLPESLVHHVVKRESNYNPRASNRGNLGLMQIRHGTARGLGYTGSAAGLLDPDTNLTYAVAYLANAYRVAGGNTSRAAALYQRGFYYEAKRKGLLGTLWTAAQAQPAVVVPPTPTAASWFSSVTQPAATVVSASPAQPAAVADATGTVVPVAAEPTPATPRRSRAVRTGR